MEVGTFYVLYNTHHKVFCGKSGHPTKDIMSANRFLENKHAQNYRSATYGPGLQDFYKVMKVTLTMSEA